MYTYDIYYCEKEGENMRKVLRNDLMIKSDLSSNEHSQIYMLDDGSILKIFTPMVLMAYKMTGISLEHKIISATAFKNVPEIIVPNLAVYDNNFNFVGYTMNRANGIDYNTYDDQLTMLERTDLMKYAHLYSRLEDIVRRGNAEGVVFPDLCTCDNIFIDSCGNVQMIDYDGLQVREYRSPLLSNTLGNHQQYMTHKYNYKGLFTSNLDKKSLIMLYFLTTFNIDLNKIGTYNPFDRNLITLDDIFNIINLEDNDIKHKVWKCLQPTGTNDFLGNDVYRIAEKYNMTIFPVQGNYMKKLRRK